MKKFALLFAAVCMVAFVADESFAQCGGGGFYGGGRSFSSSQFRGGSFGRPCSFRGVSVNFGTTRGFNNFNSFGRSGFNNFNSFNSFNRGRSFYGGGRNFYGRY